MSDKPTLKEVYKPGVIESAVKGLKSFVSGEYGTKKEKERLPKPENITGKRG